MPGEVARPVGVPDTYALGTGSLCLSQFAGAGGTGEAVTGV